MAFLISRFLQALKDVLRSDSIHRKVGLIGFISFPISIGIWIVSYRILKKASSIAAGDCEAQTKSPHQVMEEIKIKKLIPASPTNTLDIDLYGSGLSRASCLLLTPSRQQLPSGDQPTVVLVSSVKDCCHMCVQLADSHYRDALHALVDELTEYYRVEEGILGRHPPHHLSPGDYVAAILPEDGTWQRGEVREVNIKYLRSEDTSTPTYDVDGSTAEVDYCDYGDSGELPLRLIRQLTDAGEGIADQFLQLPFQAIPLQLASIRSKNPDGVWDDDAIEYFERISSNELLAYSFDMSTEDGGVLADLYDPNAPKPREKNLAAELVRMGHAEWLV